MLHPTRMEGVAVHHPRGTGVRTGTADDPTLREIPRIWNCTNSVLNRYEPIADSPTCRSSLERRLLVGPAPVEEAGAVDVAPPVVGKATLPGPYSFRQRWMDKIAATPPVLMEALAQPVDEQDFLELYQYGFRPGRDRTSIKRLDERSRGKCGLMEFARWLG